MDPYCLSPYGVEALRGKDRLHGIPTTSKLILRFVIATAKQILEHFVCIGGVFFTQRIVRLLVS
jgi:hypothetical protein